MCERDKVYMDMGTWQHGNMLYKRNVQAEGNFKHIYGDTETVKT